MRRVIAGSRYLVGCSFIALLIGCGQEAVPIERAVAQEEDDGAVTLSEDGTPPLDFGNSEAVSVTAFPLVATVEDLLTVVVDCIDDRVTQPVQGDFRIGFIQPQPTPRSEPPDPDVVSIVWNDGPDTGYTAVVELDDRVDTRPLYVYGSCTERGGLRAPEPVQIVAADSESTLPESN